MTGAILPDRSRVSVSQDDEGRLVVWTYRGDDAPIKTIIPDAHLPYIVRLIQGVFLTRCGTSAP